MKTLILIKKSETNTGYLCILPLPESHDSTTEIIINTMRCYIEL